MATVQDKLDAVELLAGYVDNSLLMVEMDVNHCVYTYSRVMGTEAIKYTAYYGFTYDSTADIEDQTVTSEDVCRASPKKGKFFSLHVKDGATYNMNVDGSSTPVDYLLSPPSGKKYIVYRALIVLEDTAIDHTKFGGITALTNGVLIKVTEDGAERNLAEHPIKTNAEFSHLAYDVAIRSSSTDILSVRWTFAKSGTILELNDSTSDNIKVTVQDDLTSITSFEILLQGYEVDE